MRRCKVWIHVGLLLWVCAVWAPATPAGQAPSEAVSAIGNAASNSGEAPPAFAPRQDELPVPPPSDAIVLFDGRGTNLFLSMEGKQINWPIEDGSLVSMRGQVRTNHLVSKLHFRDADIHVEFMLPDEGPGNSGVYLHGNYELQIYNSFGKQELTMDDMGAIYGFSKPLANASRKPGQWQVYDIRYRAPRRDAGGQIVQDGSLTAYLNGVKVQDQATFGEPRSRWHPYRYGTTPYLTKIWERQQRTGVGPVFLQDHDSPVRFRNVWVRPLDDQAFLYEPKEHAMSPTNPTRVKSDPSRREFLRTSTATVGAALTAGLPIARSAMRQAATSSASVWWAAEAAAPGRRSMP